MEELTLDEILDNIRQKYKSIAFETSVITQSMYRLEWEDDIRITCQATVKYAIEEIEKLQRRIEKGQYKEVNNYGI